MKFILTWLLVILSHLALSLTAFAKDGPPRIRSGVLDLRNVDLEKAGNITVKGAAEFHWMKFVMTDGVPETPSYIEFPGAWNLSGNYPAHGYGSYRIKVLSPKDVPISLQFDTFWSSSEIYIDDTLVHSRGRIGREAHEAEGDLGSAWIYTFQPKNSEFTITLQISNFDLFLGGAISGISLGKPEAVMEKFTLVHSRGTFLIGALFIMGLYHISLFLLRKQDHSSLYYGIFSLWVCLHIAVGDSSSVFRLLIDFSFRAAILSYNISWMMATATFGLYANSLFPQEFSKKFARSMAVLSLLFVGFMAFTDVRTFIFSTQIYQLVMGVCIVYSVVAIVRAAIHRREGASAFVFCVLVMVTCAINDMLLIRGLINSSPVGPAGVFIFTFGQSYLLSVRFAKAFRELAHSSIVINRLNESLEERVDLKTRDIRAIMEHVPIGIFSIHGEKLSIDRDYSQYLKKMLNRDDFLRSDLKSTILEDFDMSKDERSRVINVLSASMNDDILSFEMNSDSLPVQLRTRDRQVHLTWNPMVDGEQKVRKILVTLNDVTELFALQSSLKENAEEVEIIGEIVNIEPVRFERFIASCRSLNSRIRSVIDNGNGTIDRETVKRVYIDLHTMKGDARTIKFRNFSNFMHEIEVTYAQYHETECPVIDVSVIRNHAEMIDKRIQLIESILVEKLHRNLHESVNIVQAFDFDSTANKILNALPMLGSDHHRAPLLEIFQEIESKVYVPLYNLLFEIFGEVGSVAEDLQKHAPRYSIETPEVIVGIRIQEVLRMSFVHLIRNAMDHGIESSADRMISGKDPAGHIRVLGRIIGQSLELRMEDDGRGLNIDGLRQLAASKWNKEDLSVAALAEVIFMDGASTSESLTSISGRGVGMSAVRRFVESVGGEVKVVPKETDGSLKFVAFCFCIVVPIRVIFVDPDQPKFVAV